MNGLKTSPTLQKQILAYLVQVPHILDQHRTYIRPELFENPLYSNLVRLVLNFYDLYGGPPSADSLMTQADWWLDDHPDLQIEQPRYIKAAQDIFTPLPEADQAFVCQNLEAWIRHTLVTQAVFDSASKAAAGNYQDAVRNLEEAVNFALQKQQSANTLWEQFQHLDYTETEKTAPVPTGWASIDNDLDGGLRGSEVAAIAAVAGAGKSMILLNIARGAMEANRRALMITLELSQKKYMRRMDSCISGIPYKELKFKDKQMEALGKLEEWRARYPNASFRCEHFPMGGLTIKQLDQYLYRLSQTAPMPEVLLIDYCDILASGNKYNSLYEDQTAIIRDTVGLGQKWDLPLWTAIQLNREGYDQKEPGMSKLAGSIDKARVLDALAAKCQTKDERQTHEMRLKFIKMRSNEDHNYHFFKYDYTCARVWNVTAEQYSNGGTKPISAQEAVTDRHYSGTIKKSPILESFKHKFNNHVVPRQANGRVDWTS